MTQALPAGYEFVHSDLGTEDRAREVVGRLGSQVLEHKDYAHLVLVEYFNDFPILLPSIMGNEEGFPF